MEGSISISWAWGIGLICFAFGIIAGVILIYFMSGDRRRNEELEQQLAGQKQQFDDYRGQVSQHFKQTSELVQKMTDSYRDVYEHLAVGSQALCREPVSTPRLDIPNQPVLGEQPEEQSAEQPEEPTLERDFSDAETDPLMDAEPDTLLGDAPNVPSLETEQPVNPRTPSA